MSAPAFLSAHIIESLRKLEGRAKVSFPYADSSFKRTERVEKVRRGTKDDPRWEIDFGTPDPEHSTAFLVTQIKLGEDDQHAEVYRAYEELTGLPLTTIELYAPGIFKKTVRQRVPADTMPDGDGAGTLSDQVTQQNALFGEQVKVTLIKESDGTEVSEGVILQTVDLDPETGVPIYTDRFIADPDYALPATNTGGVTKIGNVSIYSEWPEPNDDGVGYKATGYSPKHYPLDARKIRIEGSTKVIVEVEHSRRPTSMVHDFMRGYQWPAIFDINQENLYIPNGYTGKYPPPWAIGADQPYGYSLLDHRTDDCQMRQITTWSVGRQENLEEPFHVTTPGTASRLLRGLIPNNCIHPPLGPYYETLPDDSYALFEDIPSSTPATYDPNDVHVIAAEEQKWRGEIYRQVVTLASESRHLSAFPDPLVDGYYQAFRFFTAEPAVVLRGALHGKHAVVRTLAPQTVTASATTNQITLADHGLTSGMAVTLQTSGTMPSPLIAGRVYYVLINDTSTFSLAKSRGGDAIDLTTAGTGTLKLSGGPNAGAGSQSVSVKLFGKANHSESLVSTTNTVTAAGTVSDASVSTDTFISLREVLLEEPLTTDAAQVSEPVTPSTASIKVRALPANKDVMYLGLVAAGSSHIYQFRTALTSDAVTSIALKTATVTSVDAGSNVITLTAHGLSDGNGIKFTTTGTLPSGLTAGTVYFVRDVTTDTFKVAATSGGSAIDIGAGSGTHTVTYSGGGYTVLSPPTVTVAGSSGETALANAIVGGDGAISSIYMSYVGDGYDPESLPAVGFSGGAGSGGAAIAHVGQANQIKIASTKKLQAANIARAIRAVAGELGATVGTGTTAHPDVTAARDANDQTTVNLETISATSAPDSSVVSVGITRGYPGVDQATQDYNTNASHWPEVTNFEAGISGAPLCTIPAGLCYAYTQRAADFAANQRFLNDATNDNDRKSAPSLPAAVVFYTAWLPIPTGKELLLVYNITGPANVKVSYQLTDDPATDPSETTVASIAVTNDSATIGTVDSAHIGKAVFVGDDPLENEITSTTTLRRKYAGSTGTVSLRVIDLVAHSVPDGGGGRRRAVTIGQQTTSDWIRLKIQQPQKAVTDRFGSVKFRAAYAHLKYTVGPDDDDA